jgi:hypothetical protein
LTLLKGFIECATVCGNSFVFGLVLFSMLEKKRKKNALGKLKGHQGEKAVQRN